MDRRTFLTVSVGVCSCLGGCLNLATDSPETQSTTGSTNSETSTGATRTPTGSLQEAASPSPTRTPFEPPPCPTRPTDLTEERAAQFAITFERAYRSRVVYSSNLIEFQLQLPDPDDLDLTVTSNGYLTDFRVWQADTTRGGAIGDYWYSVRYFIDSESTYRLMQTDEFQQPPPDPRENGTTVTCPPKDDD